MNVCICVRERERDSKKEILPICKRKRECVREYVKEKERENECVYV